MTDSAIRRHVRHCSVALGEARTVVVTARLRHGVIVPTWFPLPLDGILAGAERRRRLGANYGLVVDHHHEKLPLTSTVRAGRTVPNGKARWVWAATCAWWDNSVTDVRHIHTRPMGGPTAEAVLGDALPANPDVGRYKAWRIPTPVTVTGTLTWVALGDPDRIRDLLADVTQIGKRKGSGEGVVIEWSVTDHSPADWQQIMWRPDGLIARPWPARHASTLGLHDPEVVSVDAYRPPYWRPPLAPDGKTRPLVEVIAPWTNKPDSTPS